MCQKRPHRANRKVALSDKQSTWSTEEQAFLRLGNVLAEIAGDVQTEKSANVADESTLGREEKRGGSEVGSDGGRQIQEPGLRGPWVPEKNSGLPPPQSRGGSTDEQV